MSTEDLLKIYKVVVRSAVEYCSVVYHSLIPQYLADRLELLQKQTMRIIYGNNLDYGAMIESNKLETLASRREAACLKFAQKASDTARLGSRWFPLNTNERDVRGTTRRKYIEKNYRTERDMNNPIKYMVRLLNKEHMSNLAVLE